MLLNIGNAETNKTERIQFRTPSGKPIEVNLSPKAYELVYYYNKEGPGDSIYQAQDDSLKKVYLSHAGWQVPELNSEHLTEEYREAWEELLVHYWVADKVYPVYVINHRVMYALLAIKSSNSIPTIVKTFNQTFNVKTEDKYKENKVREKQKALLSIYLSIVTKESFDNILKTFDMLDKEHDGEKKEIDFQQTPREFALYRMLKPKTLGVSESYNIWRRNIKTWQRIAMEYDTIGLSDKNKKFVEELRVYRHPMVDYSNDPIFSTNMIEVVAETNTTEQVDEKEVINNLVVETVELKPPVEANKDDIEEIVIVDEEEEANPRNKTLLVIIIAIAAIILGIVIVARKSS